MPDHGRRSPARILAPLALGAFVVVFFAIVLSAGPGGGGDSGSGGGSNSAKTTATSKTERTTTQAKRQPATYTVKVGDTLGGISETTGVPVQKLLDLNPDLDPQALVSGQKIKLRE
jgi:LysM repeat protein